MDATSFFDLVLPDKGLRCMAIVRKKSFQHLFYKTNAELAVALAHVDAKGMNVYFGCGSFMTSANRSGDNSAVARSFWVDMDAGEGKPYATARDAAAAIIAFAAKLGIPRPMLVSSGRGIHAYWPMDEDIEPAVWKATATVLKAALRAEGVDADPSRTADIASVLRPPGSHHRKAEPREVRVLLTAPQFSMDAFQQALTPYGAILVKAVDDFLPEGGPAGGATVSNDDLTGGMGYGVAIADLIADQCGVIAKFREGDPGLDQPTWYHAMGVVQHTKDGREICHAWSSKDPVYTKRETDTKLDALSKFGPTTCSRLEDFNPTICAACPHHGHIKSPIVLGRAEGELITVEKLVEQPSGGWSMVTTQEANVYGYQVATENGKRVLQFQETKENDAGDEIKVWTTFCHTPIQPVTRMWIEGVAYVECEMTLKNGKPRRFLLEGSIIGKGKDSLAGELARNEVVCLPGKNIHMDSFLKSWMTRLKETADQVVAHRHFGWTDGSFVLGNQVMIPNAPSQRAILVGMAKSKGEALEPRGSLEKWVQIVDRAYNAPGQEGFQFLVSSAFAAPLLSMMKQVSGVTVFAHSEGSGVGKTTAQRVGLSAWGNWSDLMLADGKVTPNALWGLMGAYHSLPIVFDELTNTDNRMASELVFSVSSGRSKERMQASGELRENNSNWCTIMLASGNNLMSEKLALHRGNAEAEISRLFEYTLDAEPHLTPNEANSLFPELLNHYGHAGQVFARYVVDHYGVVQAMLERTQKSLNDSLEITQVERYWSALLASVLVATAICRNLGLLQFDMVALKAWMVLRLQENRGQRVEASSQPLELFGSMMTDIWEGILVTHGEGDIRRGTVSTIIQKPRGALVGRSVVPVDKNENPILMLSAHAVREWANKKGVSAREIFGAAVKARWCDPNLHRYSLGRGTLEYAQTSSYVACWKLDPRRVADAIGDRGAAQKIMGVIDGAATGSTGTFGSP